MGSGVRMPGVTVCIRLHRGIGQLSGVPGDPDEDRSAKCPNKGCGETEESFGMNLYLSKQKFHLDSRTGLCSESPGISSSTHYEYEMDLESHFIETKTLHSSKQALHLIGPRQRPQWKPTQHRTWEEKNGLGKTQEYFSISLVVAMTQCCAEYYWTFSESASLVAQTDVLSPLKWLSLIWEILKYCSEIKKCYFNHR